MLSKIFAYDENWRNVFNFLKTGGMVLNFLKYFYDLIVTAETMFNWFTWDVIYNNQNGKMHRGWKCSAKVVADKTNLKHGKLWGRLVSPLPQQLWSENNNWLPVLSPLSTEEKTVKYHNAIHGPTTWSCNIGWLTINRSLLI